MQILKLKLAGFLWGWGLANRLKMELSGPHLQKFSAQWNITN